MKVFLTGATGFIGQNIVRKMRQRGWQVHALVRDGASAPARWLAEQGCTLVPSDVTQAHGLAQAMAGMDLVMHNAGVYEFGGNAAVQARMQQVNVVGTDLVLGAALQAGVPRTVYVSLWRGWGPVVMRLIRLCSMMKRTATTVATPHLTPASKRMRIKWHWPGVPKACHW